MSGGVTISDLAARPEFFDDVADRIWQAWWKPHGVPLAYIAERLKENLAGRAIPRAFVAHVDTEDGATFAGTASVIASDLDERPQYRPWVAAVWVEPQFRSRKIGRLLIECAADHALQSGAPRVLPDRAPCTALALRGTGLDGGGGGRRRPCHDGLRAGRAAKAAPGGGVPVAVPGSDAP